MSRRDNNGDLLPDEVYIAELKCYDEQGDMINEVELFYKKNPDYRYVLKMGNYWHELDEDGEILSSHRILNEE